MRGDRTVVRGEAARVAGRVRALLADERNRPDESAARLHGAQSVPPDVAAAGPHERPLGAHATVEIDDIDETDDLFPSSPAGRHPPDRPETTVVDRLLARLPVRVDPGRRSALAVGVAVLLAALVTGIWLMSSRPHAVALTSGPGGGPTVAGAGPLVGTDGATEGASATTSGGASTSSSTRLVVDVAGKVHRPGVYRLRAGSRVIDAITAAGGPKGQVNLSSLNLAAPLVDGQQVAVGVPAAAGGGVGSAVGGAAAAPGSGSASGTVVDINTANLDQLETLPGVGPVLGQDIIDYRTQHGSFTNIEQLKDVSGIGDVTFADMQALVTV